MSESDSRGSRSRSFGGAEGTRTPDPLHAMQMRYQLRHSPVSYNAENLTERCGAGEIEVGQAVRL